MGAAIPFLLLIGFYGITIACCAFFYTAALFYGLAVPKLMGFQAWLGGGAVLFFLWGMTAFTVESHQEDAIGNVADWLTLFYPGKVLAYLVHATSVAEKAHYLNLEQITQLSWFQLHLWENAFTGMFFILLNLGIGIYFLGQGIKRRFHNPIATPITKQQSYWLTTSLVAILAGFSLESLDYYDRPTGLWENMLGLLCFQVPLFLGLIAALSPERQTLQDWARYRHQAGAKNTSKNLLQDLIWGEKSPSTLAIAINLAIASLIQLPLLLILPLEHYKLAAFTGILLNISIMLIYASVAQLMLMMKTSKRQIWAAATITGLIAAPLTIFGLFQLNPSGYSGVWLFSVLPAVATQDAGAGEILLALITQWGAILALAFFMMKQLKAAGASATKALLSSG